MVKQIRDRRVAILLALFGLMVPGLHKFYLGQVRWGVLYLVLWFTPIPKVASLLEAVWYLVQGQSRFDALFNTGLNAGLNAGLNTGLNAGETTALSTGLGIASHLPHSNNPAKPAASFDPNQVGAIADAIRHLEQLRQEGLVSEFEFEQKRRQLLEKMG